MAAFLFRLALLHSRSKQHIKRWEPSARSIVWQLRKVSAVRRPLLLHLRVSLMSLRKPITYFQTLKNWCKNSQGGGSTKNGRDSNAQRRGVKVYGGQPVKAGGIIVRQVGTTVSCLEALLINILAKELWRRAWLVLGKHCAMYSVHDEALLKKSNLAFAGACWSRRERRKGSHTFCHSSWNSSFQKEQVY